MENNSTPRGCFCFAAIAIVDAVYRSDLRVYLQNERKNVQSMSAVAIAFVFEYHPTLPLYPKTHIRNRTCERIDAEAEVLKHPKAKATDFAVVC